MCPSASPRMDSIMFYCRSILQWLLEAPHECNCMYYRDKLSMKYLKYQDINCLLWYSLKSLSTGHYTQLHLCSYLATVQLETIQKCFKRCRRSVSGLVHVDAHAVFRVFRWKAAVSDTREWRAGKRWQGRQLRWKVTDWRRSGRGSQAEVCGEANGYRALSDSHVSSSLCDSFKHWNRSSC